ncbi:unnamed protein product, partial [Musa hybrid cultivar]
FILFIGSENLGIYDLPRGSQGGCTVKSLISSVHVCDDHHENQM